MALRRLLALAILCPEIWRVRADAPLYPCFSSEAVPTNERRFFSFAPANVRSEPPVHCVFMFGGPPGSFLRLGLYDVRTKGPKAFRGQESASLCRSDVIRVYDLDRQGLQLRAAYCGVLRRGKMLSMSSNIAVVTYTSDSNDPDNAFNLGVDAVEGAAAATPATAPPRGTTPTARPCATPASTPAPATTPAPTAGGEHEVGAGTPAGREDGGYGEGRGGGGGGVASGDSDESSEEGGAWYLDSDDGSIFPVTSTGATAESPPPPAPEDGAAVGVDAEGTPGMEEEAADVGAAPPARSWAMAEAAGGLEGEDAGKVVTVFSNGTGDEDDDAIAFYYYL